MTMGMTLSLEGRRLHLAWYQQGLVAAALDGLYGREILTRAWIADTGETLPPDRLFAALKEEPRALLRLTCAQIEAVLALDAVRPLEGSLWFNLAAELLQDDRLFVSLIDECLASLPSPRRLVLEVSEDALDRERVVERVATLRELGFSVAMDDFGAGYSNLGRLQGSGFDIIKLDLGLLRQVPERIWAANGYREVVDLAASSGSLVVAEGVERQCQSDFVRWAGVDIIQGFLYARPQPLQGTVNGGLRLQQPLAPQRRPARQTG